MKSVPSIKSFSSEDYESNSMIEKRIEDLPSPASPLEERELYSEDSAEKELTKSDSHEVRGTDTEGQLTEEEQETIKYEPPYTAFSRTYIFAIFSIVVYIGFLGPVTGNIYIPALPLLQEEFRTSTSAINGTVAVFMAVFAIGPFLWAIHADFGGRKFLYLLSLIITIIANVLLAALPKNLAALYILRILQAIGTSAVIPLGLGTVSDIISLKDRAKGVSYFMLGPNMGPIVGPIFGGLILMKNNEWRWLFGFTSILSGVAFLTTLVFLPETLRCIVGNSDPRWTLGNDFPNASTKDEPQVRPKFNYCSRIGIQKPVSEAPLFKTLYPRPPKPSLRAYYHTFIDIRVLICSIGTAMLFATYYSFSVIFSHELRSRFNYSNLEIGACYVCPGIGLLFGSLSGGHLSDHVKSRSKHWITENRLWFQIFGLLISLGGCCGFGWSIERKLHIVVILVFSFLLAFGMTWCSNATMTYLTELDRRRTATLVSISSFFRNAAAAVASAIIFRLTNLMGPGWCFTGLAFCDFATVFAIGALIFRGKRIQKKAAMKN